MPAPTVTAHNLQDGLARNATLLLTFSAALEEATVKPTNILLTMAGARGKIVPASYTYVSLPDGRGQVQIKPDYVLDELTTYRVDVTTDLKAADGAPVAATITLLFTTGSAITHPEAPEGVTGDPWRQVISPASGRLLLLVSASPADGGWDLNTNPLQGTITGQIVLVFSKPLDAAQWTGEGTVRAWGDIPVTAKAESIDGMPNRPARMPEVASVQVDGATVRISLATAQAAAYNTRWDTAALPSSRQTMTLLPNNLVTLVLSAAIHDQSGEFSLGEDVTITFSTELYPRYSTVKLIASRWPALAEILGYDDRDLDFAVLEESDWLARRLLARDPGARVDLPNELMLDYVRCKVQWRLLSDAVAGHVANAVSEDKQLGPFRIARSNSRQPQSFVDLLKQLQGCWQNALTALLPGASFAVAIPGLNSPYRRRMNPDGLAVRRQAGPEAYPRNPWVVLDAGDPTT